MLLDAIYSLCGMRHDLCIRKVRACLTRILKYLEDGPKFGGEIGEASQLTGIPSQAFREASAHLVMQGQISKKQSRGKWIWILNRTTAEPTAESSTTKFF
jgi:hypothetical protein